MVQTEARFLVLTDLHLAGDIKRDDIKTNGIEGMIHPSRIEAAEELLSKIASHLSSSGKMLDALIFAGDAQNKGSLGSHQNALKLMLKHFDSLGITPNKIVAVPGNHDVLKNSGPGSHERYAEFISAWVDGGCTVPWLDGIDPAIVSDTSRYRLSAEDGAWVIYPINTSNWSQIQQAVPTDLLAVWSKIPNAVAAGSSVEEARVEKALNKLLEYDMAKVSDPQFNALAKTVAATSPSKTGFQVKLAVMHHHMRSPSMRVEVKPFEAITNVEQVRAFLKESGITVAIHGHKHEHAFRYDYVETADPQSPHRIAVLSAGTFDSGREKDAALLITLKGLPFTPELSVERIELPRSGLGLKITEPDMLPLSAGISLKGAPIVVQGSDFDQLYARSAKLAEENEGATIVVHFAPSDNNGDMLKLPLSYPRPENLGEDELQAWLDELVKWWQLKRSRRDNEFPYPHGSRLRLFGGKLNQIERVINLLKREPSSRAFAILVDPLRDFTPTGEDEAFPSFTLMQVRKREIKRDVFAIDVLGFYRAQEFSRWWPVNIAELRLLQCEIATNLGATVGRITTITTDARYKPEGPGQVSVPIFDRWLDQSPEKLFMLALALIDDIRDPTKQQGLVREWLRSLDDIQSAAAVKNIDGLLIPAEGLSTLTRYLEMMAPENKQKIIAPLRELSTANRVFSQSKYSADATEDWRQVVKRLIPIIKRLSPSPEALISKDELAVNK